MSVIQARSPIEWTWDCARMAVIDPKINTYLSRLGKDDQLVSLLLSLKYTYKYINLTNKDNLH